MSGQNVLEAWAHPDPDPAVTERAFQAMLTMQKIDVAKIEAATRGG
jgi:2-polyprenyl-6-hydroxyphenyl methylase/3-demethylubiquinone-9 3-methyltransferase